MATISAVLNGPKNYFDLFDLPVGFMVDQSRLCERYRALLDGDAATSYGHPESAADSTPGQSPIEIQLAYRTLLDPLARAAYLLDLLECRGDSYGAGAAEYGALEGFLMAEIELRESLDEATSRPDPAAAVAGILTHLAEQGASLEKDLQRVLGDPSPQNLTAAREILRRLELVGTCRRDAEDRRAALTPRS
ncbi:iron-sulfur cluster co-chaperone HscB C-terminal domain-containing protein [Thiocapsa marina]|uniref:Co-chaperone Hsc20 n=1 Tax=Thiocapsa marina 5811 TaxID=768671 RepID=F9U730_9GAMM|nr:iron-sulfur cluster co-chaperone HscB C-terminal domain-containing protein [Thiocapsa marina]EGV20056.1 co-chaperone Hsc20 [Thiocapsa marina 5811]